jgi:hypothetical protein
MTRRTLPLSSAAHHLSAATAIRGTPHDQTFLDGQASGTTDWPKKNSGGRGKTVCVTLYDR